MIRAVIFDWGRTLFDSEMKREFPESEDVLEFCRSQGLKLGLASLVTAVANATLVERKTQIESSPLRKYFEIALVTDADKDAIFKEIMAYFNLPPHEVAIVDDRTIRGIAWGNRNGCTTIWLRKGKFSEELPDEGTGQPTHSIHELAELKDIL